MKLYADALHAGHSLGRFTIDTITNSWYTYLLGYFEDYNADPIKAKLILFVNQHGRVLAHKLTMNDLLDEEYTVEFKESINIQNYYLLYVENSILIRQGNENIDPKTVVGICYFPNKVTQTIQKSDFTIVDFTTIS